MNQAVKIMGYQSAFKHQATVQWGAYKFLGGYSVLLGLSLLGFDLLGLGKFQQPLYEIYGAELSILFGRGSMIMSPRVLSKIFAAVDVLIGFLVVWNWASWMSNYVLFGAHFFRFVAVLLRGGTKNLNNICVHGVILGCYAAWYFL